MAGRLEVVGSLCAQLVDQVSEIGEREVVESDGEKRVNGGGGEFRKKKLGQVMGLLERETALVEAVRERLARLGGV